MKKILTVASALFFVFGFWVTASAIHEIIPSESRIAEPGPDAVKLNEYIIKYDPYRAWQLWPDKGRLYKGTEPHGALLTTFVNNAAYFSAKKKKGMDDGSIIVKENYTADKKFVALSVMYKIKGYNPAGGDWFWAKYAPDGTVEASGKVKACIDCHSKRSDNDFVFTGEAK
ncbi:MAG: cytochrome P460 family protein [Thermodesulfovibrionales bacterium]